MHCRCIYLIHTITLVTSNVVSLQYEGLSSPLQVDGLERVASTYYNCKELACMVSAYIYIYIYGLSAAVCCMSCLSAVGLCAIYNNIHVYIMSGSLSPWHF